MRFGYADPPYLGQAAKLYGDPTFDDLQAHAALFEYLAGFDGWVYHLSAPSLAAILPLAPAGVRVLAWVKPWASWKAGAYPAYAWEPVLLGGGRPAYGDQQTPRDYLAEPVTLGRGLTGAKPEAVCWWLFDCLGARHGDELDDLFPGSGAVGRAWAAYLAQTRLAFPAAPHGAQLTVDQAGTGP